MSGVGTAEEHPSREFSIQLHLSLLLPQISPDPWPEPTQGECCQFLGHPSQQVAMATEVGAALPLCALLPHQGDWRERGEGQLGSNGEGLPVPTLSPSTPSCGRVSVAVVIFVIV